MQEVQQTTSKKAYLILGILLLLFIGPIIGAWSLYSTREFVPETISYGHLISNPINLQKLPLYASIDSQNPINIKQLYGEWLMVYIAPKKCNKACQNNLYKMRQIRKMLGKNMSRVVRVIISSKTQQAKQLDQLIAKNYQGTQHYFVNPIALKRFLQKLPSQKLALHEGYLYLADPHANVMMSYPPNQKPRGIYKDLKRLLLASKIG